MLQAYVPILLVFGFVIANAILMLGVSHLLSTYRPTAIKAAPYESGMPVLGTLLSMSAPRWTARASFSACSPEHSWCWGVGSRPASRSSRRSPRA